MKKGFLFIMVFMYTVAGIYHFVNPSFYEILIPEWLPYHPFFNYSSGIAEIVLAIMLLIEKTQKVSAYLIIVMLGIFLLAIHIPMTIDFYRTDHPGLIISIIRLLIQIILICWARLYTKPSRT